MAVYKVKCMFAQKGFPPRAAREVKVPGVSSNLVLPEPHVKLASSAGPSSLSHCICIFVGVSDPQRVLGPQSHLMVHALSKTGYKHPSVE